MSNAPEPLFVETYGDRLAKAMKVARLDAKALASKAGLSRESIASYLHDRTKPSVAYNRALSWALAPSPEQAEVVANFLLFGVRPGPNDGGVLSPSDLPESASARFGPPRPRRHLSLAS